MIRKPVFFALTLLVAGTVFSTASLTWAQETLDARLASQATWLVFPKDTTVTRPNAGGNFSLHAAAESFGNPPIVFKHVPAQTAESEGEKFPTKIVKQGNKRTVEANVDIKKYKTNNKVFNGMIQETGKAEKIVGMPPNLDIYAARSALTFTDNGPNAFNRFVVSSKGTTASFVATGEKINGRSGSLSVDPLFFENVQAEDTLYGLLALQADDLRLTIRHPEGIAGIFAEAGSNFPGLSFGTLGPDHFDNPWIYRLSLVATPGANPADLGQPWNIEIDFQHNSSLAFFDPHDPLMPTDDTLIPDAAVDDTIENLLRNALVRQPGDPAMLTLASDLNLFSFRAVATSAASNVSVEFVGGAVVGGVPEPSAGLLILCGTMLLKPSRRERVR